MVKTDLQPAKIKIHPILQLPLQDISLSLWWESDRKLTYSQPTLSMERCSHRLCLSKSQSLPLQVLTSATMDSKHTSELTIDSDIFDFTTSMRSVLWLTETH
jgi:hypothetical protein